MTFSPPAGFALYPEALSRDDQAALVAEVMNLVEDAPFYRAKVPGGRSMSVLNSNLGDLGWFADERGYRYQSGHPASGKPWPAMPQSLLALWRTYSGAEVEPDACLINLYRDGARMGLHRDMDEANRQAPVLSISLGDTALFRLGGMKRTDPTCSFRLSSGDICVLGGEARMAFHGVDRTIEGSSTLIPGGGRLNLTMRRAGLIG
jgi:alkylated DNA repair protein (DNA oxidative demethylase)